MKLVSIAGGAAALFLSGPLNAAPLATDNPKRTVLDKRVDAAARTFFADKCHVGLSVAVVTPKSRHFYNYGSVTKSARKLPTRRSLYEIGSITKTFTGTLAATALLDRKMSLDGDFRAYLPGSYPNLEKDGKPISLKSLAIHKSGLPRDLPNTDALFAKPDFEKLPYQLIALEKDYDKTRYLKELHDVQLASVPGEKLLYSNFGMKLIGFGLEQVYTKSFDDLLAKQITRPLGMRDTYLKVPASARSRLVQGYTAGGRAAPHILPNVGAAGGLISSSEDLAKFAQWHLEESDPIIAASHQVLAGTLSDFALGLIWDMRKDAQGRKLWHSGGVFGMSSQLILHPDSKRAYVLLANDACLETQQQLDALASAIGHQ